LEATGYPFLAVIALHMPGAMSAASVLSSSAKMTVIDRLDGKRNERALHVADRLICIDTRYPGITNVDTIITRLQRTVDRYEGQLEIARAERRQREMNRMLREEQDAAYQASLRADQEKVSSMHQLTSHKIMAWSID
jgi:FAS-associated factor 2